MFLIEFNNLPLEVKHNFIFTQPAKNKGRFISYWKNDDLTVSLWDCNTFFAEIQYSRILKRVVNIEGIELLDERINLYLDYYLEHNDDEEINLLEIA
jgi:hypothetical protein